MKSLQISVDPRMELLSVLQFVSGDHRLSTKECAYKDEAQTWFGAYSEHPAVKFYQSIMGHFCYDAPINSMHFMQFRKELELISEPIPYFYDRSWGKDNWMQFYGGLKDFARDSNFQGFWETHQDYYKSIIEKLEKMLVLFDIPGELESYFGMGFDHYSFISSPLQDGGYGGGQGYGNARNVTCTIGYDPLKQSNWTEFGLRDFLWHEFGHGFVNPIIDSYLNEYEIDEDVFIRIAKDLKEDDRSLYEGAFLQEGVVRAMTHRLAVKYYGQKTGDENREKCETFGYEYIHLLMEALKTYESARDLTNIAFDAYLPTLIKDIVSRM